MKRHNNEKNGIFVHPIDQNYNQDDSDKEKDFITESNQLKFYNDLIEVEEDLELKTCCTKNIKKKKKFRFKNQLKPKWEEKIVLMKTNSFLNVKNCVIKKIDAFRLSFINKLCDILFILFNLYNMKKESN